MYIKTILIMLQPPKPHQGWEGTYEAYHDKPKCVQQNSKMRNGEKFGISGSEDCLYISIFTPSLDGSAAVVVFDHHDNFRTGYNGTKKYSPEIFAEEDVIVVTLNHRLSILGYLTTENDVIPANNGLRDYLLALQWVKDNIKQFGGDPNRVTLMGSKGGASLAQIMLYTKQATGLFNAVTMQGGTTFEAIYFPQTPKQYAFKLGEILDIKTDDSKTLLAGLQNIDVFKLYENETEVASMNDYEMNQRSVFPFVPVIENEHPNAILTGTPEERAIVNDVPLLIGFNSREGLDHASYLLFQPEILKNLHDFFVHFPIRSNFRFDVNSTAFKDFKDEINEFYFKDGYLHYGNLMEFPVYVGDTVQNYAINYAARKIASRLKSSTFYYMFDFYGMLNENMLFITTNVRSGIENWGASIGDELCYLHVCGFIRKNYNKVTDMLTVQNEIKVLKKMVRLWTNFAKTG
jgi:carboxylesterase type B